MSFRNNLQFLYDSLPAWMRADDAAGGGLFLRRFLSPPCAELDAYDRLFDEFHLRVNPDTASESDIDFFLWAFFGWSWFPDWFTHERKRGFYRNLATHYARRGTPRGITEFLLEFGIRSRVITQPTFYEEWAIGEEGWLVDSPLLLVVQIFPSTPGIGEEVSYYEEWALEEDVLNEPEFAPERPDIDELLRFQQPLGQHIIIEEKVTR